MANRAGTKTTYFIRAFFNFRFPSGREAAEALPTRSWVFPKCGKLYFCYINVFYSWGLCLQLEKNYTKCIHYNLKECFYTLGSWSSSNSEKWDHIFSSGVKADSVSWGSWIHLLSLIFQHSRKICFPQERKTSPNPNGNHVILFCITTMPSKFSGIYTISPSLIFTEMKKRYKPIITMYSCQWCHCQGTQIKI